MRGAVVESGEGLALELREMEKGFGGWVDGDGVEAVESADGMAVG